MLLPLLALSLVQTPAEIAEAKIIAYPRAAGEAEFVGLQIRGDGAGRCQVVESSGNIDTDAFACANGRAQLRYMDGRVYAMSFVPPRVTAPYVRAQRDPAHVRPSRPARPTRNRSPGVDPDRGAAPDEASIIARFDIDAQGRVADCAVEGPSGRASLDASLCEVFRDLRFIPATLDGAPVAERRYEIITVRRDTIITPSATDRPPEPPRQPLPSSTER